MSSENQMCSSERMILSRRGGGKSSSKADASTELKVTCIACWQAEPCGPSATSPPIMAEDTLGFSAIPFVIWRRITRTRSRVVPERSGRLVTAPSNAWSHSSIASASR